MTVYVPGSGNGPDESESGRCVSNVDWALAYAAAGFYVLPVWYTSVEGKTCACAKGAACERPAKHPIASRGVHDASNEPGRIGAWWKEHPEANVAVATGSTSGIICIDVDIGEGKTGDISITQACANHGGIPPTLRARSGSGGMHYFYSFRSTPFTRKIGYLKDVDYLADGGYVIVQPSRNLKGDYKWDIEAPACVERLRAQMAELPEWFDALRVQAKRSRAPTTGAHRAWSLVDAREMLEHVDPDDYEKWLGVGIILGRHFERSTEAWDTYDTWAARSSKHKDRGTQKQMYEFFHEDSRKSPPGGREGLSIGTLVQWAKDGGWTPQSPRSVAIDDFYAYCPSHTYLHLPTREMWPAVSVNNRIHPRPIVDGHAVLPNVFLDRYRAIEQMTWHPNEPQLIRDRVLQVSGWIRHEGAAVFNMYMPPQALPGNPALAGPWLKHLHTTYPADAEHIIKYLAHRMQHPGEKINHALVLVGPPGIGKDTILVPVRVGVGPWNCQDICPQQLLGRFNGFAKCVLLVVNEARDLGDVDRFKFHDHSKIYLAAPPDVLRVDEKNMGEYYVANVCGVVITTNHKTDGLYLPADDRRHYVAASPSSAADLPAHYFPDLYNFYREGGSGHVIAYLRSVDLSGFDPKAPPPKTQAFWAFVQTAEAFEASELRDVLELMNRPDATTVSRIVAAAKSAGFRDLAAELEDRANRRRLRHLLDAVGYTFIKNPGTEDGRWKVSIRNPNTQASEGSKNVSVYGLGRLDLSEQLRAARALSKEGESGGF